MGKVAIIFIYTLSGEGERILTKAILSPRYGSRRRERRKNDVENYRRQLGRIGNSAKTVTLTAENYFQ